MELKFFPPILEKNAYIPNFTTIRSLRAELFRADGEITQTDMTELTDTHSANAPLKEDSVPYINVGLP